MNPPSSQPGRHMLDGTIRVFSAEILLLPTGLLTAAFLTRKLGPEDYGLFVLVATLVAWVEWAIVSIFSRAAIKFVGEAEDWRPVGTTIIRLHLVASAGLWPFSEGNTPSKCPFRAVFGVNCEIAYSHGTP